mmetsp:Transcript_21168/g.46107  ORF Transcript_21168/g.46107 Transcript_21168/m.46107 type:complete len:364 (-) Transcript_21168:96-1187(-)
MKKFFEAAFRAPPRACDADKDSRFAILPQQSQDELVLSEVHSRLDRALSWLQREIGYTLLDDARPKAGGGVRLAQPREGPGSVAGPRGHRSTRVPKGEPKQVGDEEVREVIRFSSNTAKYAHYPDDLVLVWRFVKTLVEDAPSPEREVKHATLLKTVLQGVRLMHLCDYNYSDVVVTLAYASVYFKGTFKAIGHRMNDLEAANVSVLLIFLAHSFVLDETCPLRCWQKHIFRKYCTLKVLDAALFRLFQMRDFSLRISAEEEKDALSVLLCSTNGFDVNVILSMADRAINVCSIVAAPVTPATSATSATSASNAGAHSNGHSNGQLHASVGSVASSSGVDSAGGASSCVVIEERTDGEGRACV